MEEINPNELYDRQSEMRLFIPRAVTIIGLGGGGSWTALCMALMGVPLIKICDNDIIEVSNLGRTLFREKDIGRLKSIAVEELIKERRSSCQVVSYPKTSLKMYEEWKAGLSLEFAGLLESPYIIDATDNYQTRSLLEPLLKNWTAVRPTPQYCKLGYDGRTYELDYSFVPIEDSNLQGYQRINTFVGTVMHEVATLLTLTADNECAQGKVYRFNTAELRVAGKVQRIYAPKAERNYDLYKKIPIAFSEEDLVGRIVYINLNPDNVETSLTSNSEGFSEDMFPCCRKYFKVVISKQEKVKIETFNGRWWWRKEDCLLVTNELIGPEESTEELVEAEETLDYIIEEDT